MKHIEVRGQVVIPNQCIESVEKNAKTECSGPDSKHLRCFDVTLTRKAGCEVLQVKPKEKK